MLITTTPSIEGRTIVECRGIVTGDGVLILQDKVFKAVFVRADHAAEGRSTLYEGEIQRARAIALREIADRAKEMGANAIVGLNLVYQSFGPENVNLIVSASGTAVLIS
jgi:uncharacterized protein YbjQ (UPF0145 family)